MRKAAVVLMALAGLGLGARADTVPIPKPRPAVSTAPKAAPAAAPKAAAAVEPRVDASRGRVFLLRGLVNVFSLGMDALGRRLRAEGIPVRVTNFTNWRGYASVLANQYRTDKTIAPVVIMGHSLGADAAVDMANFLAEKGVPVRLVVAFDGVHSGHTVGPGIAEVINYYKADGVGQVVKQGPGFNGTLTNVDLSDRKEIDHLNIEKSRVLHAEVTAKLVEIFAASAE